MGIAVDTAEVVVVDSSIEEKPKADSVAQQAIPEPPKPDDSPKASAFSLAGLRKLKELESLQNTRRVNAAGQQLAEPFTETEFLLQWNKFATKLSQQGEKIMESLMLMSQPQVNGSEIIHEMPNESSRIDFENKLPQLLGYLRGKLHNHEIQIRLKVNETMNQKMAFTPQDRFNRLNQLNPSLEMLRRTFDLDF